jgi:hypothetical protein
VPQRQVFVPGQNPHLPLEVVIAVMIFLNISKLPNRMLTGTVETSPARPAPRDSFANWSSGVWLTNRRNRACPYSRSLVLVSLGYWGSSRNPILPRLRPFQIAIIWLTVSMGLKPLPVQKARLHVFHLRKQAVVRALRYSRA